MRQAQKVSPNLNANNGDWETLQDMMDGLERWTEDRVDGKWEEVGSLTNQPTGNQETAGKQSLSIFVSAPTS